jgi:hypothetical protein
VEVTFVDQRSVYDQRYAGSGYEERSAIPVLTAEMEVLNRAVHRAMASLPPERDLLTLLDFGYGTGRVTNDFAHSFVESFGSYRRSLHVVAYDVSAVGLKKAIHSLIKDRNFDEIELPQFDQDAAIGYIAGSVRRISDGLTVTVTFVHGSEGDDSMAMTKLLTRANSGQPFTMTTSWYSGLAHIPTADRRAAFFGALNRLTDPNGELLIAASVLGDLVALQSEWNERLRHGDVGHWPIELPGDVVYETELQQKNFYHVFGTDFGDLLEENRTSPQQAWREAVRFPDPEFQSKAEELENYRKVLEFNLKIRRRAWRTEDYQRVHTAVAIRSGSRLNDPY